MLTPKEQEYIIRKYIKEIEIELYNWSIAENIHLEKKDRVYGSNVYGVKYNHGEWYIPKDYYHKEENILLRKYKIKRLLCG